MKREILCLQCRPKSMGLILIDIGPDPVIVNPYPGEHQKLVKGTAKHSCICDRCGKDINIGDECIASSIWADYGGIPYFEWEEQHIRQGSESDSNPLPPS